MAVTPSMAKSSMRRKVNENVEKNLEEKNPQIRGDPLCFRVRWE